MGCETCNGQSMMLARGRNSWSMGDHKNRRSSGDLGNRLKINFLPVNCPLLLHLFFIDHKILPNIWYQYQSMVTSKICKVLMSKYRISYSRILQASFWMFIAFHMFQVTEVKNSSNLIEQKIPLYISIIKCMFGLKNINCWWFFMQQIDMRIIYRQFFVLNY